MIPSTPCRQILHEHLKTVAPSMSTPLPRLAAVPNNDTVQMYSLPVPLDRVMGVVVLSNALPIPAVFTFLEMLRKFDFQRLAESTELILFYILDCKIIGNC